MKLRNLTFYIFNFTFCICMAQTAPWDGLRGGVHVVTNEQDAVAMAEMARATNGIPAEIAAATNALHTSLAPTISAAATALQPAATNGLPERIAAVTNGLSAYALKTQIPDIPDLSPYALKSEVPPAPDLTGYATKYEVALATNVIPARIVAATNGLPEKISTATNALHTSLAPTIAAASTALQPAATNGITETLAIQSETLEMQSSEIARLSQQIAASQTSNTAYRLMSPDGGIYQDATGTVWRLQHLLAPGLFRLDTVQYYTNGVMYAETNELPGVEWQLYEGYENGTWEIAAGETYGVEDVEVIYREWVDFTNHVASADMDNTNKFYYLAQLYVAGEEYELETTGGIGESQITLEWPMSETNRTRHLIFSRTNVTAKVWTPADKVLYESETNKVVSTKQDALPYPTNAIPFAAIADAPSGLTTNDVCNIVTNETARYTSWTLSTNGVIFATDIEFEYEEGEGFILGQCYFGDGQQCVFDQSCGFYPEDTLTFTESAGMGGADQEVEDLWYGNVTATRTRLTRNALGLARLTDLPPLTNGLATAASLASLSSQLTQASQDATNYTDSANATAVHTNSLAGRKFDFATNAALYLAISNLIEVMGGTITNFPAIQEAH